MTELVYTTDDRGLIRLTPVYKFSPWVAVGDVMACVFCSTVIMGLAVYGFMVADVAGLM